MLHSNEKIRVPDIGKENDLVFEVNWNTKDKRTNECKIIRVHFPNGKVGTFKREHLHAFLFAIAKEEEQRKLIPQTTKRSKWYETTVGVTATKNIMKGEKIVFPIKLSLPTIEQEVVAEMKSDFIKNGLATLRDFKN